MSTALPVWDLLNSVAFDSENELKLSTDASSILANSITVGKMVIAIPIITPKNKRRFTNEIFFPEK